MRDGILDIQIIWPLKTDTVIYTGNDSRIQEKRHFFDFLNGLSGCVLDLRFRLIIFIYEMKRGGSEMKLFVFCLIAFFMISMVSARDITTLDGTTYKNVTITDSSPVGITIVYGQSGGAIVIRWLDFKDLPETIRKEFGYTEARAREFEKHVAVYQDMLYKDALKKIIANAAVKKQNEEDFKQMDHIQAFLFSKRKHVRVTTIRQHEDGVIGDATSADRTLTSGNYVHIFVRGLEGSQGTFWSGYIYPTDQIITTTDGVYAVYDSSLERATAEVTQAIKE